MQRIHGIITVLAAVTLSAACAAPAQQAPVEAVAQVAEFDPVGVYDFTTQVEGTSVAGVLTIRRNAEGRLSGVMSTPVTGDLPITNVTQAGRNLELRSSVDGDSMVMTMSVNEAGELTGGWELSSGMRGGVTGKRRGG